MEEGFERLSEFWEQGPDGSPAEFADFYSILTLPT